MARQGQRRDEPEAGPRAGILFVLSAPSGTGKTTLCKRLVAADARLVLSVSHTTREQRPGETAGVDYHFVDAAGFRALAEQGAFLEWAVYNERCYGTSWSSIEAPLAAGRDVILEIEVQGARQVRSRLPDACMIFVLPPSLAELRRRLEARDTDSPDAIDRRLALARSELEALPEFDFAVVNDDLEGSVASLREILEAVRAGRGDALAARYAPAVAGECLRAAEAREPGV